MPPEGAGNPGFSWFEPNHPRSTSIVHQARRVGSLRGIPGGSAWATGWSMPGRVDANGVRLQWGVADPRARCPVQGRHGARGAVGDPTECPRRDRQRQRPDDRPLGATFRNELGTVGTRTTPPDGDSSCGFARSAFELRIPWSPSGNACTGRRPRVVSTLSAAKFGAEKGKPFARRGRKATGLPESAGLPDQRPHACSIR
jgi:hypothetical protein